MAAAFFLGAGGWTLSEYLIHRFIFHGGRAGSQLAREHLEHHRVHGYFTPARAKATAAVPILSVLTVGGAGLLGATGLAFAAGYAAMYLLYEWVHRRVHVAAPLNGYGRLLRRHHLAHHYRDPSMNHGVTSPLWDVVFGTRLAADRVRIPRPKAPPWLVDGDGAVRARYAGEYELLGR